MGRICKFRYPCSDGQCVLETSARGRGASVTFFGYKERNGSDFLRSENIVKRFWTSVLAASYLVCGMLAATLGKHGVAVADEPTALQADHEFVQATAKGDTATVAKL